MPRTSSQWFPTRTFPCHIRREGYKESKKVHGAGNYRDNLTLHGGRGLSAFVSTSISEGHRVKSQVIQCQLGLLDASFRRIYASMPLFIVNIVAVMHITPPWSQIPDHGAET